jgi:sugar/nucleoside kinase (ribokinase family)
LIHASQLLDNKSFEVKYYGLAGRDEISKNIFDIVLKTPLGIGNYLATSANVTPFTDVFSDPSYANGHGERTFVNNIGAAWEYTPDHLSKGFFDSDIVCFGGTALVPQIHDNLTKLLTRAKEKKCITLVNTVFDFRNEKNFPGLAWPLVDNIAGYGLIDILIMDCEEASKISGQRSIEGAAAYFASTNVSSFIITNGPNEIYAKSEGGLFQKTDLIRLPVSEKVKCDLRSLSEQKGDTTGCGDNFTGGVITSLADQLKSKSKGQFDLTEAITWGVASGGFTCFVVGGTFLEKFPGEKLNKVTAFQKEYVKQILN